jgi:hypothetical protein
MPGKTRDLMRRNWQSQANLSVFLCLLILLAFVIPSMGFEKHNLPLYEDMAFSVVSVDSVAHTLCSAEAVTGP